MRLSPSGIPRLLVGHIIGDFSSNRLGLKLVLSIQRFRVGVETYLSQLVQRTRLEMFRQSRVVVVVVVVVGTYSPVKGNHPRQPRGSTPRDEVGPMNPVVAHSGPPSCCNRYGGRCQSLCFLRRSPSTRQ